MRRGAGLPATGGESFRRQAEGMVTLGAGLESRQREGLHGDSDRARRAQTVSMETPGLARGAGPATAWLAQ